MDKNKDFFATRWKCPIRKGWRYGRKFLLVALWGIFIWMSLDLAAIVLIKPHHYPPFASLMVHALLTIILSFLLTLATQQLYLRFSSRFKPIRAFQPSQKRTPGQ